MVDSHGCTHIHWKVPATILASLVAGVAFAVGHHLFYHSLDGIRTDQARYDQQVNTAIGTGFSFLVRAALVIAVGASYWQIFWYTLQKKSLRLSTIDSLAGVLGAPHELLNLRALQASPILAALGLLSWLIPFAAVVTPATLSIQPRSFTTNHTQVLDRPNFANASAFSRITNTGYPDANPPYIRVFYANSPPTLERLALGTAIRGEIPPFQAPADNCSYSLQFYAPAVQCHKIANSILTDFAPAMGGYDPLTLDIWRKMDTGFAVNYLYLSWAPGKTLVPFANGSISNVTLPISSTLGTFPNSPASLFVAVRDLATEKWEWQVLNCSLHNSTYKTGFSFENGQLSVSSQIDYLNPVTALHFADDYVDNVTADGFGFADSTHGTHFDGQQIFSYQSMMELLGKVLAGTIYYADGLLYDVTDDFIIADTTFIKNTKLSQKTILSQTTSWYPSDLSMSLSDGIEELFRNMTLATFSDPSFVHAQSPATRIFIYNTHNTYIYTWRNLVIAYGIAIVFTLAAVLVGLVHLFRIGRSFSNKFSTVVRTTRGEALDTPIAEVDRGGEDPLPKHVGRALLQYQRVESPSQVESKPEPVLPASLVLAQPSEPQDTNKALGAVAIASATDVAR